MPFSTSKNYKIFQKNMVNFEDFVILQVIRLSPKFLNKKDMQLNELAVLSHVWIFQNISNYEK